MKLVGFTIVLVASIIQVHAWAQDSSNILQLDAVEIREARQVGGLGLRLDANDLGNKNNQSLGSLLSGELGVSATGYGSGASRPVVRGLDGARVQILENGQSIADVSGISADHALGNTMGQIKEVELLRGPAALAYGSSIAGGLINVINHRIAKTPQYELIADIDLGYETANNRQLASVNLGSSANSVIWRLDANSDHAGDYKIPGYAELQGPHAGWAINANSPQDIAYAHRLPLSYNKQDSVGLGVSYVTSSGYTGISVDHMQHDYGVPTVEGSQIQQSQTRFQAEHLTKNPWSGIQALSGNLLISDYSHDELDVARVPQTHWSNRAVGGKLELEHEPWMLMKGKWGVQVSTSQLEAMDIGSGHAAIVPTTKTDTRGVYWLEESALQAWKLSAGARYELQTQSPNKNTLFAGGDPLFSSGTYMPSSMIDRQFNLWSYAMLADWNLGLGYGTSLGYTKSQRAPSAVELYGYGSHDSTATFMVGNAHLKSETVNTVEWKLYQSAGLLQAKTNLYWMHFDNYIYGMNTGNYSQANSNFSVVTTSQARATIKGAEAELSYFFAESDLLTRLFGDMTRGTFDAGGHLPLQPAPRVGVEFRRDVNQVATQLTYLHAFPQTKLADFELGKTPAYELLNLQVSYKQRIENATWTSYIKVTNLLNQDIRYSTTPETIRLYAPQMARSVLVGVKVNY